MAELVGEVRLSEEELERVARRAAELVRESLEVGRPASPYMTAAEAAEFLRCRRQRIDDLLSQGRLSRVKEGGRLLVLRSEVEALAAVDRVAHALPPGLRNGSGSGVAR